MFCFRRFRTKEILTFEAAARRRPGPPPPYRQHHQQAAAPALPGEGTGPARPAPLRHGPARWAPGRQGGRSRQPPAPPCPPGRRGGAPPRRSAAFVSPPRHPGPLTPSRPSEAPLPRREEWGKPPGGRPSPREVGVGVRALPRRPGPTRPGSPRPGAGAPPPRPTRAGGEPLTDGREAGGGRGRGEAAAAALRREARRGAGGQCAAAAPSRRRRQPCATNMAACARE